MRMLLIAAALALCGNVYAAGNAENGKAIAEKVCGESVPGWALE